MIWNQVPFLRILFPFIIGILLWEAAPSTAGVALWVCLAMLTLLLVLSFNNILSIAFKRAWIYSVILNMVLCLFGYALSSSQSDLSDDAHFSNHLIAADQGLLLEVRKPVDLKIKSVQAEVEVLQILDSTRWFRSLGTAIVYFRRDSLSEAIEVGDKCLAFAKLEKVSGPRNPGAFDYAKYLSRSDIYFSAYIADIRWKRIGQDEEINLYKTLNRFKLKLEGFMREAGVSEDAHSVISALTLGDKAELSMELKTSYSKAGVLHILAVSGLHVGIFYLVLSFLLGFIEKIKHGKYLKALCVIGLLWGYAVLTGMSPSVTRAATMFSFVVIGTALHKHTNVYNTLCVSAFFLLLFQPADLFNVGFLLSYTAVLGIVYLYPKIYGFWTTKVWLLDKIWVLTSVSLAAQIVTFPLSLYYFHQFPNYFLLANIIVVPLATCIIYMTIVLFALIPLDFLAKPMATLISFFVETLNSFVRWIEGLPFAVTDGIEISSVEVILIYVLLGAIIFYLNTKKYAYLFGATLVLLFLALTQVIDRLEMKEQHQLIVYDVPKHSAFDIIEGYSSLLTTDSTLILDSKTIGYVMENNWRQMGVRRKSNRILEIQEELKRTAIVSLINGKRVVFPLDITTNASEVKVWIDILILSNRCETSVVSLNKLFDIGLLVIDTSWPNYKLPILIKACEKLNIPYYSVQKSGAFVRDF